METHAQGIRLSYDDLGRGEPALLMLPGWCANRTELKFLAPLASACRRTLALDWRGHGESGAAPTDFGVRDLVNDALAIIEASGAASIIPVAISHSGWVALELRRRLGRRIPKLVLLDWIILEAPAPFVDVLEALQDPAQWESARQQLFSTWLEGIDHPEVIRFVREEMAAYGFAMWARAAREILVAYTQAGSPLKALAKLSSPVPTLHLYSQPADPGYLAAQQAFASRHPWFQVRRLAAKSDFLTLEVPEMVAAQIEHFVLS
ncbi:MAG: alpha/beta fold hydrolase [Ktedonobacteraceae bacterium]